MVNDSDPDSDVSRFVPVNEIPQTNTNHPNIRAADNFLKQGVAYASLGAKGVFLQNPEVLSLPSFYMHDLPVIGGLIHYLQFQL